MSRDHVYQYVGINTPRSAKEKKINMKITLVILCTIEIIGIIYGKCIAFTVCLKDIYIYIFILKI
jgi:hypothetical protein